MKRRILYVTDKNQFEKYNYSIQYDEAMNLLGGNSGNTVFQYALQSMLSDKNTQVTLCKNLFTNDSYDNYFFEQINNNYDCIVYSPANIIAKYAKERELVIAKNAYRRIKKPIYVIGLGAQSNAEYSMNFMNNLAREVHDAFDILLNNGGKISVRGYFTGECLVRAGFSRSDFTVTGCPSLFLKGRDLQIGTEKVKIDNFRPLINGFRAWSCSNFPQITNKYNNSIFVCQDEFYKLLYLPSELSKKEIQYISDEKEIWYKMYMEDRIKLYCNFQSWYYDLLKSNVSFSYGCRIHGNIVPLLAGIPAYVDAFDSRVREMAEFFDIPCGFNTLEIPDLYELYLKTDYKKFNLNFSQKYDNFIDFMDLCGLPHNVAEIPKMEAPLISSNFKNIITKQKKRYVINSSIAQNRIAGKKIVFVARNFGFFKKHSEESEYVYHVTKSLIQFYHDIEIHVIATNFDEKCELYTESSFHKHKLFSREGVSIGNEVLNILKLIKPDYVECTADGGFCLESLIYKKEIGAELKETRIFANHILTTQLYCEWSKINDISEAVKEQFDRECAQMKLVDKNITLSAYMCNRLKHLYGIESKVLRCPFYFTPYNNYVLNEKISEEIDIDSYADKIVISSNAFFDEWHNPKKIMETFIEVSEQNKWDSVLILVAKKSFLSVENRYLLDFFDSVPLTYKERVVIIEEKDYGIEKWLYAVTTLGILAAENENFPLGMLEYVYCGIPILVSKNTGLTEFMESTYEYTVFDPDNPFSMRDKLSSLINLSKFARNQIAMKQFQELWYMTNPVRALYLKIDYFTNFGLADIRRVDYNNQHRKGDVCL